MSTGRVELGEEDVLQARARKRPAPKVHRPGEIAREEGVARAVHRDASWKLVGRVAETLAPEVVTRRVELGEEDVSLPGARERPAPEVDRP